MNIYLARYKNALRKAAKINRYLKKGYHVFYNKQPVKHRFILDGNNLLLQMTPRTYAIMFVYDTEFNNGVFQSINEFNKFISDSFDIFEPKSKVTI